MMNATHQNIMEIIKKNYGRFHKKQQKVANFILRHYPKVAFLTASQLGEAAGISQPTVVRFCQNLGFSGYSQFIGTLQKRVRHELLTTERFSLTLSNKENPLSLNYPQRVLYHEIKVLKELADDFPLESFEKFVSEIIRSKKIFVIGMRGSSFLSQYFSYFLTKVKRPVLNLYRGGSLESDQLMEMTAEDLAIIMAFPRYPRETIEIAQVISEKGGKIFGITDNVDSPLVPFSSEVLLIPVSFITLFDSYSAPLCVLNMLVTEVARRAPDNSQKLLEAYENLAQSTNVFFKMTSRA